MLKSAELSEPARIGKSRSSDNARFLLTERQPHRCSSVRHHPIGFRAHRDWRRNGFTWNVVRRRAGKLPRGTPASSVTRHVLFLQVSKYWPAYRSQRIPSPDARTARRLGGSLRGDLRCRQGPGDFAGYVVRVQLADIPDTGNCLVILHSEGRLASDLIQMG